MLSLGRNLGLEQTTRPVAVRPPKLPVGAALRLEYVRKGMATVQYVTVRGDRLYALVYTTLPEFRPRYARLFEASARTLSLGG